MIPLPDINLLVYAHREDSSHHDVALAWLQATIDSGVPFALCNEVLSGFVRIVTHPKIYDPPSSCDEAFEFARRLRENPNCTTLRPGPRHWEILESLCRSHQVVGGCISDAWLAALAIEHDCEFISFDADFGRFDGLKWRKPSS